ncbi:hypothetical protein [Nocardia tengchongensis]|uniref:hypothetical protein n=1 Tax=Nocardia tengchongensis TaxID=2055889 RepID=UPI0036ACBAC7
MKWTAVFGPKAMLAAENDRLRRTLVERDSRVAELSAALDDALDREQLHSLSAPHERLTPAAVLDRCGQHRAEHLQQAVALLVPAADRGSATKVGVRPWMTALDATADGRDACDRRRSR